MTEETGLPYVLSERNLVERNDQKYNQLARYCYCGNCNSKLIKLSGKGYKIGHQNIITGWYCRRCKLLYCNDNVKAVSYTSKELAI